MDFQNIFMRDMKLFGVCDNIYDKQLELLINVWTIIAFKILILIFLNTPVFIECIKNSYLYSFLFRQ
jgi:hypothetical protein